MRKFLLVVLILAVVGAGIAWWGYGLLNAPYRGFTADEVFVEIPQGAGVSGIASRLAEAGVVSNALAFRIAARLSKGEIGAQATLLDGGKPVAAIDLGHHGSIVQAMSEIKH